MRLQILFCSILAAFSSAVSVAAQNAQTETTPPPAAATTEAAPAAAVTAESADNKETVKTPPPPVETVKVFKSGVNPADYEDPKTLEKLLEKRYNIILAMYDTRTHIIKTDPRAAKLQREIAELTKRLAVIVEDNQSMRELNSTLNKTDQEISKLKKKNDTGK